MALTPIIRLRISVDVELIRVKRSVYLIVVNQW